MNELIYVKEKEILDFCEKKNKELEIKYPNSYFCNFTKAGKKWNYYMAIRVRAVNKMRELIEDDK